MATLAALGAESVSMGTVAYTSTVARRRLYLSMAEKEAKELQSTLNLGRDETLHVLKGWGFKAKDPE